MARQIIVVGMARTATMHIATLYKRLFEANGDHGVSFHQNGLRGLSKEVNFFNADWEKSKQIYTLAQKYPFLRFIITYRDPIECCNSLLNFYKRKGHKHGQESLEWCIKNYWVHTYRKILDQLSCINPKPHVLNFFDYTQGKCNDLLLDLFDLPHTQENKEIVSDCLKKKINTFGYKKYEMQECEKPKMYRDCLQLGEKIKEACGKSWVDQEIYGKNKTMINVNNNYPPMVDMYKQKIFGREMGQTFTALYVFEWILNLYPLDCILEIGTGRGGLTMFLQLQANIRHLDFITFDARNRLNEIVNNSHFNPPDRSVIPLNYKKANVFDEKTMEEIKEIAKSNRVILYCDNGNKPKEVRTYAPLLQPGSIIGCHDWTGQFGVDDLMKELNYQSIFDDFCTKNKTRQKFWYKVK